MTENERIVLVAGAINTDLVATVIKAPEAGETITGESFATYGGGKGANQAVAAARSGASVALIGAVGDDVFGKARLADLQRDGIDRSFVKVDPERSSGVALITVERGGENRIAYVPGATAGIGVGATLKAFESVRPAYVLAPNELPADALGALFEAAVARKIPVVFNATPDPKRSREMLSLVSILIVNRGEAAALCPGESDPDVIASTLIEQFALEAVLVTMGADGALVATGDDVIRLPAPTVEVVDTTGAGDTFAGSLVARLADGANLKSAAAYAIAASALSVTRHGAQESIPFRSEVNEP